MIQPIAVTHGVTVYEVRFERPVDGSTLHWCGKIFRDAAFTGHSIELPGDFHTSSGDKMNAMNERFRAEITMLRRAGLI